MNNEQVLQALRDRVGPTGGRTYRAIYNVWSARPTKKGTPEKIRAYAALALARCEENPSEYSFNQARLTLKFPG